MWFYPSTGVAVRRFTFSRAPLQHATPATPIPSRDPASSSPELSTGRANCGCAPYKLATSFTRSSSSALRQPTTPTLDRNLRNLRNLRNTSPARALAHHPHHRQHGGRATLQVPKARVAEQPLGPQHRRLQRWRSRTSALDALILIAATILTINHAFLHQFTSQFQR